jgi:tetratricopeptide (TPR) repeat protein
MVSSTPRPALHLLVALLCAAAAACATPRATPRAAVLEPPPACPSCPAGDAAPTPVEAPAAAVREPDIQFPPQELTATRLDLELAGKNDEELFAVGTAAYGAKDFTRAAAAFARLADLFPASRHLATALFDAGLAYEQLEEWRLGLERFRTLARGWEGPDALEAAFKVAECQYQLRELGDAHASLAAIAARPALPLAERVRVLVQLGVVELEDGRPDDAERSLRKAVGAWQSAGDTERLDPYYPAQAEYYLGETYREWFRALAVDPSGGDERRLQEALEHKSELLLSAQGHYLRAIRMGDDRWAVASGYRVGELYDEFRRQLLDAPLPPGLDEEAAQAYRTLVRDRVRVLAAKAVSAYESALFRASRAGVDDLRFLSEAQDSLQRLKEALAEVAGKS